METELKCGGGGVAKRLGYSGLKTLQEEVVVSFIAGHDVFAILPTGYGKSLCYLCLPEAFFYLLYSPPEPSPLTVFDRTATCTC